VGHLAMGPGLEPKSAFLLPSTCYRQASLLKSETWGTHALPVNERSSHPEISLASQVVHHGPLCLRLFSERTADNCQQMDITDGFL
jgi:hypothetical protein